MNNVMRKAIQGRDIVLIGGPNNAAVLADMHTDTIVLRTGKYEATGFFVNGREQFQFKEFTIRDAASI